MTSVFVDTSYLLALELERDQNHRIAIAHWRGVIAASLQKFVTTSYVFDEVVTFFKAKGYHSKAVEVGAKLLRSPSVQLIHVDEGLFYEGWAYLQRHPDKNYSLTDCISFTLIQKLGISLAYTFDQHFAQAGYAKEP